MFQCPAARAHPVNRTGNTAVWGRTPRNYIQGSGANVTFYSDELRRWNDRDVSVKDG